MQRASRLSVMMQNVGFTIWQLQELEDTIATYLVVRSHALQGIGAAAGDVLLSKARGRSLGSLLTEITKTGLLETGLATELRDVVEKRNWVVHRARRECRGILTDDSRLSSILSDLNKLADCSLELQKRLTIDLERFVVESGVDRGVIDAEADRLQREWGLLEM